MSPMLIIKFGPLGTDLDRMTLKFFPRQSLIKKSKWPTISNLVILKIFHVTYDIDLKFGTGDARVCTCTSGATTMQYLNLSRETINTTMYHRFCHGATMF